MTASYEVAGPTQLLPGRATVHLALVRAAGTGPVPVLATPPALAALRLKVGDQTRLSLGPADADVQIVGTVDAIPGDTEPAAMLTDLPSLSARFFHDHGIVRANQEWWVGTDPEQRAAAAQAAAQLGGLRVLDRQTIAEPARPVRGGCPGGVVRRRTGRAAARRGRHRRRRQRHRPPPGQRTRGAAHPRCRAPAAGPVAHRRAGVPRRDRCRWSGSGSASRWPPRWRPW